jgi:hypothetical protein
MRKNSFKSQINKFNSEHKNNIQSNESLDNNIEKEKNPFED